MVMAELAGFYGWTFEEMRVMKSKEMEMAQKYMRKANSNQEGGRSGKRH